MLPLYQSSIPKAYTEIMYHSMSHRGYFGIPTTRTVFSYFRDETFRRESKKLYVLLQPLSWSMELKKVTTARYKFLGYYLDKVDHLGKKLNSFIVT